MEFNVNTRNSTKIVKVDNTSVQPPLKKRKLTKTKMSDLENVDQKPDDYYDLYSRQFYAFGEKAMNNLGKSSIFISGLGGVGVEIAKNVILAGPKKVTLHDTKETSLLDLSTQYYLTEQDIGTSRLTVTIPKLGELNPYVELDSLSNELSDDLDFLANYDCVVLTECSLKQQIAINCYCRANSIKFIACDAHGVFSYAFADFGEHQVWDKNGESELESYVGSITHGEITEVNTLNEQRHGLESGDTVKFTELTGADNLEHTSENPVVFEVQVTSPTSFTVDFDSSQIPEYKTGGIITEVKQTVTYHFKNLTDAINEPEIVFTDLAKLGKEIVVHLGFQSLYTYIDNEGSLPRPWNQEDAQKLVDVAKSLNSEKRFIPENEFDNIVPTLEQLSFTSQGGFIGITAVLGGHVAQEIVKAVSGKFSPLYQWIYFDFTELLNDEDHSPQGCRYDGQIICLGAETNQRLRESKLFMIGVGAIGCEMLKNYAMMGIATAGDGKITITDPDHIEKSNLNRQFLFRDKDIQQPKSETAAASVLSMNPSMNIEAHLDKVCPDTEDIYSNDFFIEQTVIVNALDNIEARKYVDSRCVTNGTPLLESGTMGTKGHIQVILPFKTETYSDTIDPPENDVAFCTIKSFPGEINHTIEWARDKFESMFVVKPREVEKFLRDPQKYIESLDGNHPPSIGGVKTIIKLFNERPSTFEDCLNMSLKKFYTFYRNAILQLLHAFPVDMKLKNGEDFWKLPKRPPSPINFGDDGATFDFVFHAAALYAHLYNIEFSDWDINRSIEFCRNVEVPPFVPKKKNFVTDESLGKNEVEEEVDTNAYETACNNLKELYNSGGLEPFTIIIDEFEKDDDSNHHIDFITACSNLRAINYSIPVADRMKTKRIAGKIIPAIATTTTLVSGLVSVELVKIIADLDIEAFKQGNLNLALPYYGISEPGPPIRIPIVGDSYYTVWERWQVDNRPDITVEDFCSYWEEKYNLEITAVFYDIKMVYVPMMPLHDRRLKDPLSKYVRKYTDAPYADLIVTYADKDTGDDVNGPTIRFWME
eukprot:TRINITY_DN1799_c0_g3_i1.p1 TRINITY_DN1799_c0_g3~~TRINITY_DN1799_c0_g3_i1.p1  ORF type:complete len:1047 (-),score=255.67 TRINITY_DN1799_c0_g3_i1:38-3178(-)